MNRKERRKAEKQGRKARVPGRPKPAAPAAEAAFDAAHRAFETGDAARAEALCRDLTARHPDHAAGHNLLGIVLCRAGRSEDGVQAIRRAIDLAPGEPSFEANLGVALSGLGRNEEALAALEKSLALAPDQPRTLSNTGSVLRALGRPAEARAAYEKATALAPDFAEAWSNFGNVLSDLEEIAAAEQAFQKAIALSPTYAAAHNNLGSVVRRLGRYADAETCFRRALELDPRYGEAMNNLAEVHRETARAEDALALYDAALDALPAAATERAGIESNRLYALNMTEAAAVRGAGLARAFAARFPERPRPRGEPAEGRALRVGFVSSDLRRHSVSYFLEPLWAALDPAKVAVFGYPTSVLADDVTARLKNLARGWQPLAGLSDADAAARIAADGIDVLIDLNGHTMGNRLGVFAERPAPAQATWLGYPNTTGLAAIDARIVDAVTDPPESTQWHSEDLIRLERPFLCYQAPGDAPDVAERPAGGAAVFGSFNNLAKVSAATLDLWAAVLNAMPESRLVLKTKPLADPGVRARVARHFAERGVAAERLDLFGWITEGSHLSAYGRVDVGLDTYPYHGTTTTCEALWMGVPVVTLVGQGHAARVGASILGAAGLSDLAAKTPDDYIGKAVSLGRDGARRAGLRRELRATLRSSALMDAAGFACAFEQALRGLHRSVLDRPGATR